MSDSIDCIVIGAGVIGLAVASRLASDGRNVICLEAEAHPGAHTSSRNSEVIHAGIYYPAGSLKARLCVAGREQLYRYCESRRVPFRKTGKLIVAATVGDVSRLESLLQKGLANGVTDLELVDRARLGTMEPAVRAEVGLYSPSTGIIDSHSLMMSLQAELEAHDGHVICNSTVASVASGSRGFTVTLDDGTRVECSTLINAAGLRAPAVAACIEALPAACIPRAYFAKAHYFMYAGRCPFSRLIYPLPEDGGLGVHATLDLGGGLRFGPDVEWVDSVDYAFDDARREQFIGPIRSWFPDMQPERLSPGYTGIRPKLTGPGEMAADFRIDGPESHGAGNLVNLFGIESPGLTACLAIADIVAQKLQ